MAISLTWQVVDDISIRSKTTRHPTRRSQALPVFYLEFNYLIFGEKFMRKLTILVLTAVTTAFLSACAPPAENKPANTNTNANTVKPVAAAPTIEELFAMDKQANEAWIKGDRSYFESFLSDKFVSFERGQRMTKTELVKMIGSFKCDVKDWKLEDQQMAKIDADTYVMSYKGTFDGSCTGEDGKAMKLPSPIRAASIFVRDGDKWKGAFHAETLIIDPKNPPSSPAGDKKDDAKKEEAKTEAKKEAPKADDKAKTDDKTAAHSNTDANGNSNTAAPAKPASSANTEALMKLHNAGWDAWKAKDAKKLTDMSTNALSLVNPLGTWIAGQSNTVKHWTEEMKCEGVNTIKLEDGVATALSPTVEMLTLKGTADGTCDGQKNGALYQTAVYVKDGDSWKLAFMFETPAM